MDNLSYFLIAAAYIFSMILMLYFIPRQTAELAAEQQKESFAPLRPSILWFSFLMLIPIYVLRSLLSQLSFPLSLLATALHQLQLLYVPILFYRALLPTTPFYDPIAEMDDDTEEDITTDESIDILQQADACTESDDTALMPEGDSIDIPQQKEE